jgi:hypothetical protein
MLTALFVAPFLVAAQGSQPNVDAIQTQIANLQATLTVIANAPAGTPAGPSMEFDFYDADFSNTNFHVEIQSFWQLADQLHARHADTTLIPRGRFVAIHYIVTNLGNEPSHGFGEYKWMLRDQKGRTFSYDDDATMLMTLNLDLYANPFQPGLAYAQIMVYDVAKDATSFTLEVQGTTVALPLGRAL